MLCRRPSADVLVRPCLPIQALQIHSYPYSHFSSVTPNEGELFKRFSPELQKHNLENRERRQRDYEDFVGKLKEYSKSDKPSMSLLSLYKDPVSAQRALPFRTKPMAIAFRKEYWLTEICRGSMGSRRRSTSKGARGVNPAASSRCRIS
jgi:CBP4